MGKVVPVPGSGMGPGPKFFPHWDRDQKQLVPFMSIYHI